MFDFWQPSHSRYLLARFHGAYACQCRTLQRRVKLVYRLVQRRLGRLADLWGARRLQLISGLLIPILPIAWVFTRSAWHVIPINLVSGVLWGAYGLASFNLLLELIPQARRARYSAIYQVFVTLALAAGAAMGGWMVTKWGYNAIFITSAVGRFLAALLFARFVRMPVNQ